MVVFAETSLSRHRSLFADETSHRCVSFCFSLSFFLPLCMSHFACVCVFFVCVFFSPFFSFSSSFFSFVFWGWGGVGVGCGCSAGMLTVGFCLFVFCADTLPVDIYKYIFYFPRQRS